MKKKLLISVSTLFLAVAFVNCGKKGPDLSKYDEICAIVQKCDQNPQSKMLLMQPEACQKMFTGMENSPQTAAFTPQVLDCVKKAPCEKLDTFKCVAGATQGIMPVTPAPH